LKKFLLATLVIALSGCTATGPTFTHVSPPENEGILYLYRVSQITHSIGAPEISLNSTKQGKLTNGGYMAFTLPPGKYTIKTDRNFLTWDMSCNELQVKVTSGKNAYVRLASGVLDNNLVILNGTPISDGAYQCAIFEVPEEVALSEIASTKKTN